MDMVYSASGYCVRGVRRSIIETEGVSNWEKLHILGERPPAAGIIVGTFAAVGMNFTRLEHHSWISRYVLSHLLLAKGIGHTEGIACWQQLFAHLAP